MFRFYTKLLAVFLLLFFAGTSFAASGLPVISYVHTPVDVTVASGEALAANASRGWAIIENDSDTDIYCKIDAAAALNEGIGIYPKGSYEISPRYGNFTTGVINCIHGGSGNKRMLVTEGE